LRERVQQCLHAREQPGSTDGIGDSEVRHVSL
jgi:hypothetical protein